MDEDPDQIRDPELHRKSLHHFENNDIRFLTFSCFDRLPLFGSAAIRTAFCEHLERVRAARGFDVLAYCVMPEHVHLIIDPQRASNAMPQVLFHLKKPFASEVLQRWRLLNAAVLPRIADSSGKPHSGCTAAGSIGTCEKGSWANTCTMCTRIP